MKALASALRIRRPRPHGDMISDSPPPIRPTRSLLFAVAVGAALACLASFEGAIPPPLGAPRATAGGGEDDLHGRAIDLLKEAETERDAATKVRKATAAAEMWLRLERLDPDNLDHAFWAGRAYVMAGDADAARAAVERMRRKTPYGNDARVAFLTAEIHLTLGNRADLAVTVLERLRRENPAFLAPQVSVVLFLARLQHAAVLVKNEAYEEAVRQYQHAILERNVSQRSRDMARRNLAHVLRLSDRYPESQAVWEDLVARYPADGVYRYQLATIYATQYMWDKAAPAWKDALGPIDRGQVPPEDAPAVADAHLRYGVCLYYVHRYDEAKAELEAYAKAYDGESRAWYWLGVLYEDNDRDPDRAVLCAEKARALDPLCENVLRLLLRLYTGARADEAKAAELEKLLDDPKASEARKAEMERRKKTRQDRMDGCN